MVSLGYSWSVQEIHGFCRKVVADAGIHLNCPKMQFPAGKTLNLLISQEFLMAKG